MALSNRTWTILLLGSLGLNLFLLGTIAVHVVKRRAHLAERHAGAEPAGHERGGPPRLHEGRDRPGDDGPSRDGPRGPGMEGAGGPPLMRRLVRVAGGPRDPRVRKAWDAEHAELSALRGAVQTARQEVDAALVAEPFSAERLGAALSRLHESSSRAQAQSQKAVVTLASELTPQERSRLARDAADH
jgi:uncharacterized membrane protein